MRLLAFVCSAECRACKETGTASGEVILWQYILYLALSFLPPLREIPFPLGWSQPCHTPKEFEKLILSHRVENI